MQSIHTGEIRCRICDPLTLFIDPAATTDDEIRWIVEEKPRDIDYVKEKYGKEVQADENVSYAPSFDVTQQYSNGIDATKKNKHMVMVRELWMKPCKKYPNGLKVTTTRSEYLDSDENAGEIPYIIFGDIPIPGSVKYKAFIEAMLPIQRNLNIMLTMMATNMKKMGSTKWLVPLGSNVDEDQLNDEISGIIEYNASNGGAVQRVPGADLPNGFDRVIEYYNRMIDDMSGAREVSQGRLPAGLDTASGLQLMVEQENEKMAVNSQNYERGMKKLLKRVLRLMKKHYTEERMGRILGADNEIELVSFTGSDLSGEEDINIIQGSSLPEMKSAQQERILTLWDKGAIVNDQGQPDSNTLLRMLGLGDSNELFEQKQLDENNSKMENKQFEDTNQDPQAQELVAQYLAEWQAFNMNTQELAMQGVQNPQLPPQPIPGMPKVWDSDDHTVHLYNHNLFRKSSVYRQELTDQMRALVDMHVQQHIDAINAPAQAEMQQQAAAAQEQQAAQAEEADKQHQRALEMKQVDNQAKANSEALRANTALQTAQMKTRL
ncbi:hypothetical protein OMP38_14475 [Cohnella ginsengisoli]|uniref:Uncharacterized protein n=1 Tax=Cohnella ginsengisoli TaxID=425004 RepID=A0A9X4KGU3_9BACL|nr:hypothetical protein [Cohnella ginsengisoli]MDG0791922.1 hypothetical protein [Cohnella ginsengisoli]